MRIKAIILGLLCVMLLVSPALADITPMSNMSANTTTPAPTALTPQRDLGDFVNASSAGVGNLTKNITILDVAQAKAPVEIPRKLFFTIVVLFGGFVLMGVALNKPGGFAKFRTGFLVVLGGGLVLAGVLFGMM